MNNPDALSFLRSFSLSLGSHTCTQDRQAEFFSFRMTTEQLRFFFFSVYKRDTYTWK